MQSLIQYAPEWALPYVYRFVEAEWSPALDVAWLAVAAVGLVLFTYILLRALGWRRYQGRWYSPAQLHALVRELRGARRAGKPLDARAMRLVDRFHA